MLLDAGVAQEASAPEALPAPVFAEAVVGEDPAAAGRCAEDPTMIIDLPLGQRVSSRWRLRARSDRQHFGPFGVQLFRLW